VRYYKIIFNDCELIKNDNDHEKYLDDNSYLKCLIKDEIKYLAHQGIQIYNTNIDNILNSNEDYYIVSDINKIKFKYFNISIITECDRKGNLFSSLSYNNSNKLNNTKFKIIFEYLKTKGVVDCKDKNNLISFSCPICKKDNEKMYIYKSSFIIKSHSHTDCNHYDEWKIWTSDLWVLWKENYNPDFAKVKWNNDFVIIKYKQDSEDITCSLSQYNSKFEKIEIKDRPKIKTMNILQIFENTKAILNHYKIELKFNIIKRIIDIFINGKQLKGENVTFENYLTTIRDNCTKKCYKIPKEKLEADCLNIALNNKYNPIEDYLKYCHKVYLNNPDDSNFKKLLNSIDSMEEDKDWYIYHSLLQMVYMGCRPELEFDRPISNQFLPVFQGVQGTLKTTWFRSLLPKYFQYDYFYTIPVLDLNNKDHIIQITSNWLVEIGEMASTFKKSDQDQLKNYITDTKDYVRIPFAKQSIDMKRRTCFCGTTNDFEYLKDLTGSRRFLTMGQAELCIDETIDIDAMWGYFYQLYLDKTKFWHDSEDIKRVENNNKKYMAKPEFMIALEEELNLYPCKDSGEWLGVQHIYNRLNNKLEFSSAINLGKQLKKLNVVNRTNKKRKTTEYLVEFLNDYKGEL
jgi:predicted P-loop ATPase